MTYCNLGALPGRRTRRRRRKIEPHDYNRSTNLVRRIESARHPVLVYATDTHRALPALRHGNVIELAPEMAGYLIPGDSGLGFSLKPPKFIRRAASAIGKAATSTYREVKHLATIKNIGIAAGALVAAPFVIPAITAGAAFVGSGIASGAGLLARGALGAGRLLLPAAGTAAAGSLFSHGGGGGPTAAPIAPNTAAPLPPPDVTPSPIFSDGGGGGGGGPMFAPLSSDASAGAPDAGSSSDTAPTPTKAGLGGNGIALLAIGGLALWALSRKRGA